MLNNLHLEREATLLRPAVTPVQRHKVELDGIEVLKQKLEGVNPLQGGDRLEVPSATSAGLHSQHLTPILRHQRPQSLVLTLAAVDAAEPLDLPLPTAAATSHSTTPVKSPTLRENRPSRADWTIAVGPKPRHSLREAVSTRLQQRKCGQVGHRGQWPSIDTGNSS